MESVRRFLTLPTGSFFLLGPRGTGKSTWLKEMLPHAATIDLLDPTRQRELVARPERLREFIPADPTQPVVLDEVQHAPGVLSVVHQLMETRPRRQFVLTGSSARKLRRGGTDLLGGRALDLRMHPFMPSEWPAFDLPTSLRHGLIPVVQDTNDRETALASYVSLYLDQEVRMESLVRNIGDFARFLEAASFSHGCVLNVATISRDCSVERKTVSGYLGIVEDLLLSFTLPVFRRRAKRETSVHPKFYMFDAGVFRSLRPRGPLDIPRELDGPALEGLVAQTLRAWISYSRVPAKLSFWRTRSGVEVDFVVYGGDEFTAIDVQNSTDVRPADVRALNSFLDDYPEATGILLYRGQFRMKKDRVWCLPVEEYLRSIVPGQPLTSGLGASQPG